MANGDYPIKFKVEKISYREEDEKYLTLDITNICFNNSDKPLFYFREAAQLNITMKVNISTFFYLTGKLWDGTNNDLERIRSDLEGKVCTVYFGRSIEKN